MYGVHRDSIMSQKYGVPNLQTIKRKLLNIAEPSKSKVQDNASAEPPLPFAAISKMVSMHKRASPQRVTSAFPPKPIPQEPEYGNWIRSGETIEALSAGFWYVGKISWINGLGQVTVSYTGGINEIYEWHKVRPFEPYKVGDVIQVEDEEEVAYWSCMITSVNEDGTYDGHYMEDDSEYFESAPASRFRYLAERGDGEAPVYKSAY
jgi:hypothetical protein